MLSCLGHICAVVAVVVVVEVFVAVVTAVLVAVVVAVETRVDVATEVVVCVAVVVAVAVTVDVLGVQALSAARATTDPVATRNSRLVRNFPFSRNLLFLTIELKPSYHSYLSY